MKFQRDCVFLAPALDQASQLKLTEIKEKVGSLERLLERDVAKNAAANSSPNLNATSPSQERALPDDADDDLPANEDEKDLEPTPLAVVDAAYEIDGEDDDLLDLGIQLGKMRITERIGGFFRPKIAEEVCQISLPTISHLQNHLSAFLEGKHFALQFDSEIMLSLARLACRGEIQPPKCGFQPTLLREMETLLVQPPYHIRLHGMFQVERQLYHYVQFHSHQRRACGFLQANLVLLALNIGGRDSPESLKDGIHPSCAQIPESQ